jgi:hypothetical protein
MVIYIMKVDHDRFLKVTPFYKLKVLISILSIDCFGGLFYSLRSRLMTD